MSATATASCSAPPTAAPLAIPAGTTTCARPAGPRIQVGPEQLAVSAKTADPTERSRLFPRFVQMYKGYAGYDQKTSRQIPLVVLTPEHRLNMT